MLVEFSLLPYMLNAYMLQGHKQNIRCAIVCNIALHYLDHHRNVSVEGECDVGAVSLQIRSM